VRNIEDLRGKCRSSGPQDPAPDGPRDGAREDWIDHPFAGPEGAPWRQVVDR